MPPAALALGAGAALLALLLVGLALGARARRADLARLRAEIFEDTAAALIEQAEALRTDADRRAETADRRLREEVREEGERQRRALAEGLEAAAARFETSLDRFASLVGQRLGDVADAQRSGQGALDRRIEHLTDAMAAQLRGLGADTARQLDEMRATVDEKLQSTLEKRLNESFAVVSDSLAQVHSGLGEMQALAASVGDLKRTLSNVKTRGVFGEMQLIGLVADMLGPDQFIENAQVKPGTQERVELAVRLPGQGAGAGGGAAPVLLPVDSKFPLEDYERLLIAVENADPAAAAEAGKALERRAIGFAAEIASKYVNPPATTDFAVMYLPTEGLFAEMMRRPGLAERIRRELGVVIAGPTTLTALLSSLQVGFRTLAIEQRSAEVWSTLGLVKTEFGKFGEMIAKVRKKLDEAGAHIDSVDQRSRAMQRKLKEVESLPDPNADSSAEGLRKLGA